MLGKIAYALAAALLLRSAAAHAQDNVAAFYKGRTIQIVKHAQVVAGTLRVIAGLDPPRRHCRA
jgi:hypothetical protein